MHGVSVKGARPLRHVHLGGQQDMNDAPDVVAAQASPTIAQHAGPASEQTINWL